MDNPLVSIVAAIGRNRELGHGNELLWHIPDDLKRFKQLTLGHPVILGRKTFESIVAMLGKPLPGRTNIVVTRNAQFDISNYGGQVLLAQSLDEALQKARELDKEEVFIGGGADLWAQALPHTDRLYLTLIDDVKDADTFFPEYENTFTKKVFDEAHEHNGLKYRWVNLEK